MSWLEIIIRYFVFCLCVSKHHPVAPGKNNDNFLMTNTEQCLSNVVTSPSTRTRHVLSRQLRNYDSLEYNWSRVNSLQDASEVLCEMTALNFIVIISTSLFYVSCSTILCQSLSNITNRCLGTFCFVNYVLLEYTLKLLNIWLIS